MRNELLTGYVIHTRKYREKSHIVYLFSQEHGRVNGILRQAPPPQYQLMRVYATGRNELKTFNQLELSQAPTFLTGDAFFIGFYLNELLLKILPMEQQFPELFQQYQQSMMQLLHLSLMEDSDSYLRQILRQFEYVLLSDLGDLPNFDCDVQQQLIVPSHHYYFEVNEGFVSCEPTLGKWTGEQIIAMQSYQQGEFNALQLSLLTGLCRQILNHLLGNKPLKSRQLWQQHKAKK